MRQQMAEGDRMLGVFLLNLEVGQIIVNGVVKLEFALLHLLEERNRGHRFEGRTNQINSIWCRRSTRPKIRISVSVRPDDLIAGNQSDRRRRYVSGEKHSLNFWFEFSGDAIDVDGLGATDRGSKQN